MSRFYGIVDGDAAKHTATRIGHRALTTYTSGWDQGIQVHARSTRWKNNKKIQEDYFDIYLTGGSNCLHFKKLLISLTVKEMDTLLKQNKDVSFMDLYLAQNKRKDNE